MSEILPWSHCGGLDLLPNLVVHRLADLAIVLAGLVGPGEPTKLLAVAKGDNQ